MAWRLRKGAARAWFIGLSSLLGLVLTLLLIIAWLLTSESGRLTLLDQAEYWLPRITPFSLQTDGVRSPAIGDWRFEQLRWQGGDGVAVDADNLHLQWRPRYLWQRRLWIDALSADQLTVQIPATADNNAEPTHQASGIPDVAELWSQLPAARLDQLVIHRLSVQHANWPELHASAVGELAVNWGSWPARLELTLSEANPTTPILGDSARVLRDSVLILGVSVDAVDTLRIQGELTAAANSHWARALDWPLPQDLVGQWDVQLSQRQGQLQARIDTLNLPWRQHTLNAQGGISLDPSNGRLFFSEFELSADGQPARLHGFVQADRADLSLHADALPLTLVQPWLPLEGLEGALSVDGQLSGGWRTPRFAGRAAFDGQWQAERLQLSTRSSATRNVVTIEQLELNWGPAKLAARGRIDWGQQRLDLSFEGEQLADRHWRYWVPAWPDAISVKAANVNGSVNGPLNQPVLTAAVSASGAYNDQPLQLQTPVQLTRTQLALADIQLGSAIGDVSAALNIDFRTATLTADSRFSSIHSTWLAVFGARLPGDHDWQVDGQLNWSGALRNPDASGRLQLGGQWQDQPLTADIKVARLNLHQVTLADSQLTLGDAQTGLSGQVDWRQRQLNLSATPQGVQLASIRPFTPPWPALLDQLNGQIEGRLSVNGPWTHPRLISDLRLNGDWLDLPISADLDVQAQQRDRWQVNHAGLHWGDTQVHFTGWVEPFTPALDGQFDVDQLTIEQLHALAISLPDPWTQLNGTANARGRISGNLLRPQLTNTQARFSGQIDTTPVQLNLRLAKARIEQVDIEQLQLTSNNASLNLNGQLDWIEKELNLRADLSNLDWAQVESWVPANLSASLSTLTGTTSGALSAQGRWPQLTIDGRLNAAGRYLDQDFQLNWRGQGDWSNQVSHSLSLNWGDSRLDGQLNNGGAELDGQLTVDNVNIEQLRALGLPLGAGVSGQIKANLGVAGQMNDPEFNLQMQAAGRWQPASAALTEPTDWRLNFQGQGRRDNWQLQQAEADLGRAGQLSLSGGGSKGELTLNGQVNVTDSRYWLTNYSQWSGALDGDFQLTGSAEEPVASARFNWRSDRWPLSLDLNLDTDLGEHHLNVQLREADVERLNVSVQTAQTALSEWQAEPTERPFNAELRFDTDSTVFEPFFQGRPDQDFNGQLQGKLNIAGSLSRPQWSGDLALNDGRYENATYGAVLADMNGTIGANHRTLQLQLQAADDGGGTVQLAGSVVWPEDREVWWMPELDLGMTTRNAHLLRRADMDASVSGEVSVSGPWRDLTAAGSVEVAPLTIQLNSLLQSGAPSLNVVRSDDATTDDSDDDAEPALLAPQGQWQVRLRADRRAQIYGQGLAAELSGELDLTDALASPNVGGRFQVIRGTYTAFGKIFEITSGNIQLQGSQILLDITATYSNAELSVELRITGTQDRINLMLTSTPPLANDELLARLLFGTSLNEMSAVQAFQLAAALNSLRDPSSGLDLFGTTRELLGLDSLSLDSDTNAAGETGVNVQAGKYLSDQLYLQVESGLRTEQSFSSRLQFQVTPEVSLELYTNGQYGTGGLELNWSEDY